MKKVLYFLIICIVLFSLISNVNAISASIGNAKMILYPEVNGIITTTIDRTILVRNVNDEPVNIKLTVNEEGKEFLELVDEKFLLEPGEEKKAKFQVKVRKEGKYEGKINVLFSSLESNKVGVALPSEIIVNAKKNQEYQETDKTEEKLEGINLVKNTISKFSKESSEKNNILGILAINTIILALTFLSLTIILFRKQKNGKEKEKRKK